MNLYDYGPRLSQLLSIDKLLNNKLLLEMVKIPTASLNSDTTKSETSFDEKNCKRCKNNKTISGF